MNNFNKKTQWGFGSKHQKMPIILKKTEKNNSGWKDKRTASVNEVTATSFKKHLINFKKKTVKM